MSDFLGAMWPVLAIMLCYAALTVSAQMAAQPARRRMLAIAHELREDKRASEADREKIDFLLDMAMSWKVGALGPLAIASFVADILLKREEKRSNHWLWNDPRTDRLAGFFIISTSAANVLMALVNVILLIVAAPLIIIRHRTLKDAVGTPAFRAVDRLRHSH